MKNVKAPADNGKALLKKGPMQWRQKMARSSRRRNISKPLTGKRRRLGLSSPALTRLSQKYVAQSHVRIVFTNIC
jgi:hypothetical protein